MVHGSSKHLLEQFPCNVSRCGREQHPAGAKRERAADDEPQAHRQHERCERSASNSACDAAREVTHSCRGSFEFRWVAYHDGASSKERSGGSGATPRPQTACRRRGAVAFWVDQLIRVHVRALVRPACHFLAHHFYPARHTVRSQAATIVAVLLGLGSCAHKTRRN